MSQLRLPLPNKAIKPFFVLFSHPVRSDSLWSHGLQHSRPPWPSPSPGVCPSSFPLHWWYYLAISFSDALFSFSPQSFLTSGTFSVSQLFTLGSQSVGASASASVLPMTIQGWFLLGLFGGFYLGSDGKESTCNVGDLGLIPGLEWSPEGRPWQSTPACYLENLNGQRSLGGYSPWVCKVVDTTECLSTTQDWLF